MLRVPSTFITESSYLDRKIRRNAQERRLKLTRTIRGPPTGLIAVAVHSRFPERVNYGHVRVGAFPGPSHGEDKDSSAMSDAFKAARMPKIARGLGGFTIKRIENPNFLVNSESNERISKENF